MSRDKPILRAIKLLDADGSAMRTACAWPMWRNSSTRSRIAEAYGVGRRLKSASG
jgi:hypothetical protein